MHAPATSVVTNVDRLWNGQEDFEKQITIRAGSSVKAIQDFAEAAAITAHPHSHYSPSLEATSHGLHAEAGRPLAMEPQLVHKVCGKCNVKKGIDGFGRNKARSDGLCSYCKPCNAAAAAKLRRTRVPVTVPTVTHKVCRQCVRDLPSASYHHATGYKDGLTGKCKECCIAAISQRAADRDLESVRRSSEGSNVTRQPEGADVDSCIAEGKTIAGCMSAARAFVSLSSSMSSRTLSYSKAGIGVFTGLGSEVPVEASPLAQWEGIVGKRQRDEPETSISQHLSAPSYGQVAGEAGQMSGLLQLQQQQHPPLGTLYVPGFNGIRYEL